jgi:hypothetical protein
MMGGVIPGDSRMRRRDDGVRSAGVVAVQNR